MTEADEKLSRLFAAQTADRDAAFADAVEARLRQAMLASRAFQAVVALAFVTLAAAGWVAWRVAKSAIAQVFSPIPAFQMDFLGAPAPALALLTLAGLWFAFRRFVRLS
jgi:hypothetical protein